MQSSALCRLAFRGKTNRMVANVEQKNLNFYIGRLDGDYQEAKGGSPDRPVEKLNLTQKIRPMFPIWKG